MTAAKFAVNLISPQNVCENSMATQVVELSGDEASLFRSLSKVIAKEVAHEKQLKSTGEAGGRLGDKLEASLTGRRRFSEQVESNAKRFGYRPPITLLEWMMGFPENFTDLGRNALATPSSHQPLSGSVGESSNTIAKCGVTLSRNALHFGRDLSYEEWESVGAELGKVNQACQWWIGDWINYGEKKYGQTYEQALAITGLAKQTLMDIASVCRDFETSRRREVSFRHHVETQSLSDSL